MYTQKGFAHILLILVLVVAIIGALAATFWVAFSSRDTNKKNSDTTRIEYKKHTTITGSGLTFTYPSNWTLLAADQVADPGDGSRKFAITSLVSEKPIKKNGKTEFAPNSIMVSFVELQGDHPFRYAAPTDPVYESQFVVGGAMVGLVETNDGDQPTSMLVNIEDGLHGRSYIALENDYFVLATARYGEAAAEQEGLRDKVKQAKKILESVRVEP